ncbi:FadR/GntR family transcriptional regulator [Embleya hyalina]|uniref:GntR family transcriptional regulator n=1 Tax=Embleya hyalina TaxID=516124 RepID=A0A401YND4_9ACTN|nr:FCD domain-containing protein [Embleya hyalina]GCD96123.1 GntR family transcriptional regulator [Embleya hyalina]
MTVNGAGPETPKRESHANRIARLLIDDIRRGTYPVGTRIPSERRLAQDFGVSRPVIREAVSTVIGRGILEVQMGRGMFVTAQPADGTPAERLNLQDVVNVREVLETGALRLSALREEDRDTTKIADILDRLGDAVAARASTAELDSALHTAIVEAGGSPLLLSLWQGLQQQIDATIRISPHGHTMSPDILALHRTLADGVLKGHVDEATTACRQLHEQNRDFLRELLG